MEVLMQSQSNNFIDSHQLPYSDVTDNNTSFIANYNNKGITMVESYFREDERLQSFQKWNCHIDKKTLAATGMYYTGQLDKVKCYFCEVEIGQWEPSDHPVDEHIKWSPNCPLLRRRATNNIAKNVEELETLLPEISYDTCGSNNELFRNNLPEASPANPQDNEFSSNTNSNTFNTTQCSHEFPEYAIETARLRSYDDWPKNMKQKPAQLAEAGFFYTGKGDRVICYSCGGGLKDWDDNDDPWEQHALWLKKCHFLKLIKGQSFIDEVIEKLTKTRAADEVTNNTANQQTTTSTIATSTSGLNTLQYETASSSKVSALLPKCGGAFPVPPALIAVESLQSDNLTSDSLKSVEASSSTGNHQDNLNEKSKSSSQGIPEEKLCKICYANEYNTAFLPCGHVVACAKCASSVTKCPLCRKLFTDVMRVYFS